MAVNQFRIVCRQFDFPLYATSSGLRADWTDNAERAYVYDQQDNRETKLKYWRAIAHLHGFDPASVQIEEWPP